MAITLVGGGARSGKSAKALMLARQHGVRRGFIATAEPRDAEMRARIERHQKDRGDDFYTIEEPLDLARALLRTAGLFDSIVVDCLTLWLSNLLLGEAHDIEGETRRMLDSAEKNGALVVLVTNEAGCGIVPENELARRFRDYAGRMNQTTASAATEVYWMVFGCALKVK